MSTMDIRAYIGLPPCLTINRAPLLFLTAFFCLRKREQERLSFQHIYVDPNKILTARNIGLPNLSLST